MDFERSAGILLHPTSLPGKFGIGDIGPEAYNFADFLEHSGQLLWQVFPLGPTGYGDSPYQCFSAFAGNPNLISPEHLVRDGLLEQGDIENVPGFHPHKVDYGQVIGWKRGLLEKANDAFQKNPGGLKKEYDKFIKAQSYWLDDFALFMALKDENGGRPWIEWEKDISLRKGSAVEKWTEKLAPQIAYQKFAQFIFYQQWGALKKYVNGKGIKIIGDMPIFIAYDSSDCWANRELFSVDKDGKLETVAGVPPDYFSATGQLWGNPLYRWSKMEKNDFKWWRDRFNSMLEFIDIVRLDHFRGFAAYWEIPGDAETAIDGRWVKAPGHKFFSTLKKELGDLPILAEDLGVITPDVEELRDAFGFPGMKILQFAFGTGMDKKFLPHNHIPNSMVYTGTHDNDTTRGYFEKERENPESDIFEFAQEYLNYDGEGMVEALIKEAYKSASNLVIIPMQDVLNLGTSARMNFPGTTGGNWTWRFSWDQMPDETAAKYKRWTELYERPRIPEESEDLEIEDEK